uniref:Uncharacterized protein n=1 Tax=Caenorhabditis japonica TaxID=281687 RepID=A0A8R1DVL4_CAEJA
MLRLYGNNLKSALESAVRFQSTGHKFQTKEEKKDGTTYVSMERVSDSRGARKEEELCSLCTCNVPVKLSYKCVMQAYWSGLFGEKFGTEADRAGYKRFNRYWKHDMSMYQLETKERHGTWFYIKRYQTKNQPLFKNPLN